MRAVPVNDSAAPMRATGPLEALAACEPDRRERAAALVVFAAGVLAASVGSAGAGVATRSATAQPDAMSVKMTNKPANGAARHVCSIPTETVCNCDALD